MFGFGTPELLIIGVLVMLVFGVGKLPEIDNSYRKNDRQFQKGSGG